MGIDAPCPRPYTQGQHPEKTADFSAAHARKTMPRTSRLEKDSSMDDIDRIFLAMTEYFSGDARRIQHFVKVHAFARLLGREEGLNAETQFILEAAALVHDIGIKKAEAIYGSASGALQEKEGPAEAEKLLQKLGLPSGVVERVCYLVGHHHTYANRDGADYRILVEADFLVNLHDDGESPAAVRAALERVFSTPGGKALCRTMFGLKD